MQEPSGLVLRLPKELSTLVFGGSKKSSIECPADCIFWMSFFVRIGPPSLQHRIALRLHLNLNCFWVIFRSWIVRFFGLILKVATMLFIVC